MELRLVTPEMAIRLPQELVRRSVAADADLVGGLLAMRRPLLSPLAKRAGLPVLTADQTWAEPGLTIEIRTFRLAKRGSRRLALPPPWPGGLRF